MEREYAYVTAKPRVKAAEAQREADYYSGPTFTYGHVSDRDRAELARKVSGALTREA